VKTPDITPVQTGALTAALVAVVAAIQAAPERVQVPLVAAVAFVAAAWIVGDAVVRHGRSGIESARVAAVASLPPDALDAAVSVTTKLPAPVEDDGHDAAAHGASS